MWSVDRQGGLTKFSYRWSGRNVPEIPTCFRTTSLALSLSFCLSSLSSFFFLFLSLFLCPSFANVSSCWFVSTSLLSLHLSLAHTDKDFVPADHRLHSPLYAPFFFPLSLFLSRRSLSLSRFLGVELIGQRPETARS